MNYEALQTRRFARQYKKLHHNIVIDVDAAIDIDVDAAIDAVSAKPSIGERKKGDLAGLHVYKFRSRGQRYLLGYTIEETVRLIYLEAIGPHENFYRDLKRF